jgi:hypothetical protein
MATLCGLAQGFRATVRQWAAAPRLPPELLLMSRYNSAVAGNIRLCIAGFQSRDSKVHHKSGRSHPT